jgi:PAS domain S-box-containing protein
MVNDEKSKLRALNEISSIDITLEFDRILEKILDFTCKTINAHSGTIMLVDEADGELRMVASYRLGPNYIEEVYKAAEKAGVQLTSSPSGTVLKTGNYYSVPNVFNEPKNRPWFDLSKKLGFSAQIFVPMKRGMKVTGLLNVYMADPHHFTDEEINFLIIAASQAASVVQNAMICTRLKENIHELKQYEEKLEDKIKEAYKGLFDSEAKYRELFENSQEGICVTDISGHFLSINKTGLQIFGCTSDQIIGTKFSEWFSKDSIDIALSTLEKLQSGEITEQQVIREIIRPNGEHRWIEAKIRAVKEYDRITGFHGMINDITEKKDMELKLRYYNEKLRMSYEKLKIAEVKYRDLFENASDGIYIHDIDGYFTKINKAGLEMFGCLGEEIIGSHFSEWLNPASVEMVNEIIKDLVSGKNIDKPAILEVVRKNGELRLGEIKVKPFNYYDKISEVYGIIRDVTEKNRLEQKLAEYHEQIEQSYEDLKQAHQVKTEFISNITHELLTPLTLIRGYTELIIEKTIGDINDEQKEKLHIILRNTDRLIGLIQNILTVTELENNRLELQIKSVSVNEIIIKILRDIQPQFEGKKILVVQDIHTLPEIFGDDERLARAITNLIINAIKFTPEKGKITITAVEEGDGIKISIRDTGTGIPTDKLPFIFDRYYQANATSSRKDVGIGFGLSISKEIIEMHDGIIWAESDENGSTFNIVLPKHNLYRYHKP